MTGFKKMTKKNTNYVLKTNNKSIDKTYFGYVSGKHHIHRKPLMFNYKIFSAATSNGY